jgi:isopenicillin N synthase-like dioxygenase
MKFEKKNVKDISNNDVLNLDWRIRRAIRHNLFYIVEQFGRFYLTKHGIISYSNFNWNSKNKHFFSSDVDAQKIILLHQRKFKCDLYI